MARINVEDSLWSDSRFMDLCMALGCKFKAAGAMVMAWKLAQKYWCPDKKPIPIEAFVAAGLPEALVRVGLASKLESGIKMRGCQKHFAWWFEQQERGRLGGIASAKARKEKFGTAQPNAKIPEATPNRPPNDPNRGFEFPEPSSSFSFSNSKTNKELRKAANGELFEKAPSAVSARAAPLQVLIGVYVKAWQARYGTRARPDVGGKSQGILKRIAQHHSADQVSLMLQVYCQMDDEWFKTKTHDLGTFEQNLNKVALAMDLGKKNPTERTWRDAVKEAEEHDRARVRGANGQAKGPVEEQLRAGPAGENLADVPVLLAGTVQGND